MREIHKEGVSLWTSAAVIGTEDKGLSGFQGLIRPQDGQEVGLDGS